MQQQQLSDIKINGIPPSKLSSVAATPENGGSRSDELEEGEIVDDEDVNSVGNADGSSDDSKTKLKYEYKDDQWSPLNPEGKKQYDRDVVDEIV